MQKINVAIVGATGLVGSTTLALLEERQFPIESLYLLASHRSVGETRQFKGKTYAVEAIDGFDFTKTHLAFFSVGNTIVEKYVPLAVAAGNCVIDKSSFYRRDSTIPLIVPEVNFDVLNTYAEKNIIANPNCNTIPIVVALKPIYDAVGITRMNIATYQSVSGTGKEAVMELRKQSADVLEDKPVRPQVYSQQIAFNVLPHIDDFWENGYTQEEMKMVWEIKKIFQDDEIKINPTAVRVPVFCGHSAAVHIETREKMTARDAIQLLKNAPGVQVSEEMTRYPTPVMDAAGKDGVYVGRVRNDISHSHGLNFWIVADNLRKGAALNAIQIAERVLRLSFYAR